MMNNAHVPIRSPRPRLSLQQYRCLHAIGETGSVTQAARMLDMTQSAVSHQLREAERRLGIPLYNRVGKRLRSTPAGERLEYAARHLLPLMEQAEAEALARAPGVRHVVRIGSGAYSCYRWLPGVLQQFQQSNPDVDVQVMGDTSRPPLEALLQGDIDLAINAGPLEVASAHAAPLFRDELVLITAPDHPLAARRSIRAEDLADETYITYSFAEQKGYECERMMRPAQVFPRRIVKVEITEGICELVSAGFGVSVLSRWAVAPWVEAAKLRAVRLSDDGLFIDWHACVRRTEASGAPAALLAEAIAASCSDESAR